MNNRDRMIDLLNEAMDAYALAFLFKNPDDSIDDPSPNGHEYDAEFVADYIISKGAVAPQVKVGQTVYVIGLITKEIVRDKVIALHITEKGTYAHLDSGVRMYLDQQLENGAVFFDRKSAECALREFISIETEVMGKEEG